MAGDKVYSIKVVVYPFGEIDKKKLDPMMAKEIGVKKPKNFEFSDKFSVTSAKWDKKRIEDAATTMFRYDLSVLAAQMWEQFVPIQKAKNGQDKMKKTTAFLKIIPKLLKQTEKKLTDKFAEMKEDIATGAMDDIGEIKGTRKSLTAGHVEAISKAAGGYVENFGAAFKELEKLKNQITKSSGGAKEEASKKLDELLGKAIPEQARKVAALDGIMKKRISVVAGIPAAMKKSMNKDVSDSVKNEYKVMIDVLTKATKPLEVTIPKFGKEVAAALVRMKRKDISSSVMGMVNTAHSNLEKPASKLTEIMLKIDAKLKKLEQTAKKR